MSDLIDRQAAIDAIFESALKYTGFMEMEMYTDDDAVEAINGVPSAWPERKKGRWINYKDEHCCSVCDWIIIEECWDEENRYDYCPYCGADMRGDGDEAD